MPLILTAMFLLASALTFVGPYEETIDERISLKAEPVNYNVASPGHSVFLQYVSSDDCFYCYHAGGGSESAANLKQSNGDEFVYITYSSVRYVTTNDARSGNIAPIYAMNHLGETGGAPTAYAGDSDPEISGSSSDGKRYDSSFSAGGNMYTAAADYQIAVQQSVNSVDSSMVDITMQAAYIGTGSAPSSTILYAAVTEDKCAYTYADNSYGHNCWKAWLLDSNSYATTSGTTGSGTGFVGMNLQNGAHTETWTVPASLARARSPNAAGIDNMLSIGAIYSSWSTSAHNADVYAVSDSSMVPLIDVGVQSFSVGNSDGSPGFIPSDTIDLSVTVQNNGVEAYNDGGDINFYYLDGNTEVLIDSTSLNSLTKDGASDTQTYSTAFDTSSLSVVSHGQTTFRTRISGMVGDGQSANNFAQTHVAHDVPPSATLPIASGSDTVISREGVDTFIDFELKPSINDGVDDISTMTGELEVKDGVTGTWSDEWISGGDQVFGSGDAAHLKFRIEPSATAGAGDYDIRTRWIDNREQMSDWIEYEDAFSLLNGLPAVIDGSIPTVKVDTPERISLLGIVTDAETALNELVITSSASEFKGWHANDMEIEVLFASEDQTKDASGNYMQQNMQITMNDGTDSNTGTIRINIIDNGAPRWAPVQAQTIEEGGMTTLALSQFLSDTDDQGGTALVSDLTIQVLDNDGPDIITTSISGQMITIQTVDSDVFGDVVLQLRAHDGVQYSDTEMIVHVTNVNDAPRINLTGLEDIRVKISEDTWIDFAGRINDIDTDNLNIWTDVSSDVAGAAKWNPVNETLKISYATPGLKVISFSLDDAEGGVSLIQITVEIIDALPLVWDEDGSGDLSSAVDTLETSSNPRMSVLYIGSEELTDVRVEWSLCNTISGTCTDFGYVEEFGGFDVVPQSGLGLRLGDQIKIDVKAVDSEGFDRKSTTTKIFDAVEAVDIVEDANPEDTKGVESESQSDEVMSSMTKAAIGGGLLLFFFIVILSLTFVMKRGKEQDLDPYAQQLLAQGYGLEVAIQTAAAHQDYAKQRNAEQAIVAAAPAPAATLPDYTHLPAGGDYRTGFNGETIYVEPSGASWTMLPDNSFVRNQ
jgi:hypothetical protein